MMKDANNPLADMDRTAKEELARLLKNKQILQKENILERFFDPSVSSPKPNPVQEKFFKSPKMVRAMFSGNGSGKTSSLIIDLILTHTREHPFRDVSTIDKTWLITPSYGKIPDYIDEIKKWCPPAKLPKLSTMGTPHQRLWTWPNGSTTTLFSAEQDREVFEGTNIDALYADEPFEREIYIAAFRGMRRNPNHFFVFAGTALTHPWLYTDIYLKGLDPKNTTIDVFQGSIYDNIDNIDKEWLKEFETMLTEEEKAVRLHGGFAVLQGRVFKDFERRTHVIPYQKWSKDWPVWIRIDCHTRKPSTAVWLGVSKDEEIVVINEAETPSLEELGDVILDINARHEYRVIDTKMDNSGLSTGWNKDKRTAFDILREQGVIVSPVKPKEKDVDDSILRIKRLLKPQPLNNGQADRPKLLFMENCAQTIKEMELYGWKESRYEDKTGKSEKVMKVNDDYIDPLRYGVMARPRFHPAVQPISYGGGHHFKKTGNNLIAKLAGYKEKKLQESAGRSHGRHSQTTEK